MEFSYGTGPQTPDHILHYCPAHNSLKYVPAGSPSSGGDVAVYVSGRNQLSLPTPYHSALVSISVLVALSTVVHSINSPNNGLISALLVLSTILRSLYESLPQP